MQIDGQTQINNQSTWAAAHDATGASTVNDSAAERHTAYVSMGYNISRAFFLFDTSTMTDSDAITSATFSIYITGVSDQDNDGQDYLVTAASSPASPTALSTADFDDVGSTAFSDTVDISNISTGQYTDWTLNASGRAAINKAGITKFSQREGHDMENSAVNVGPADTGATGTHCPRKCLGWRTACPVFEWCCDSD